MEANQLANVNTALEQISNDLPKVLPSHIKPEKFLQVCYTAAMLNPDLAECSHSSLATAFIQSAKDGLVPDGKEAAIVIYNTKQGSQWVKKAQYQPMIDGVLKRLRQSGEVSFITAKAVYEGDKFDYWIDEEGEHLQHRPSFTAKRDDASNIFLVYAMAKLKNGERIVEVMTKEEVDKIMYMSKSAIDRKTGEIKQDSVWGKFWDRMALKTVLHRISRRLPNSSEVMEMLERDIQLKVTEEKAVTQAKVEVQASLETINQEEQAMLQAFAQQAGADEAQMFGWISAQTGRIVNSYCELDKNQAKLLTEMLDKKIKKRQTQQVEQPQQALA